MIFKLSICLLALAQLINVAVGVCPNGQVNDFQVTTDGDQACPSGSFLIQTFNCEPYDCNPYDCNGYNCDCKEKCNTRWCTFLCCETVCDTCFNTCFNTCFRTCRDCQFCKNTPAPTKQPTRKPTAAPTRFPTVSPTKAPVPTPEPTDAPTISPTLYPTNFPSRAPTLRPTDNPTRSPVPPTTGTPTAAPVPPTDNPTPAPTKSPTEPTILTEDNLMLFGIIAGVGGGCTIAAVVIIYRRGRSGVDTAVAEELLEWKAKNKGAIAGETHNSLSNPMFAGGVKSATPLAMPEIAKQRNSLKGINIHAWMQEAKDTEKKRRESIKAGKPVDEVLKMKMKYDFVAENEDELTAKKGDILYCLDKKEDWFVASNPITGESGIVPMSYVIQYLDDDEF